MLFRTILLLCFLIPAFPATAQTDVVYSNAILGKWITPLDPANKLTFDAERAYHQDGAKGSVYKYMFVKIRRDDLMLFIDQQSGDTTVYAVLHLTDEYMSIRNTTKQGSLWSLEKVK